MNKIKDNIYTVNDLINELQKIEDKTKPVTFMSDTAVVYVNQIESKFWFVDINGIELNITYEDYIKSLENK